MSRLHHHLLVLALLASCGPGGAPPEPDNDRDGDGILDLHEGEGDTDGDGVVDADDTDSDDDGIPDALERGDDSLLTLPFDTDQDGVPDFQDTDSDGNGIADSREPAPGSPVTDHDGDGLLDAHDLDDDDDGLPDVVEIDEVDIDTDGDGLRDRLDPDSDNDGIADALEGQPLREGRPHDHDGDGTPDYVDEDSDGDGFTDADESGGAAGWRDTDEDGRPDSRDRDADNDGLADDDDPDPLQVDADGDGVRDGVERWFESDPLDAASMPEVDLYTVRPRIDVGIEDTIDVDVGRRRVDVIFLPLGRNSSHSRKSPYPDEVSFLQAAIEPVWGELIAEQEEVAVGAALYFMRSSDVATQLQDRGYSTRGPLFPLVPPTRQESRIPEAMRRWEENAEGFMPYDAAHLAIDLVLTGRGYDANCDGVYDPRIDTLPYDAARDELFGGTAGDLRSSLGLGRDVRAGMGFRPFSMPILVWNYLGRGDPGGYFDPPEVARLYHGCYEPTSAEIGRRLKERGGRLILLDHYDMTTRWKPGDFWYDDWLIPLLDTYDAWADIDGDGVDDPLIVHGNGYESDDSAERISSELLPMVQHAIEARDFYRVDLTVAGDEHGVVVSMEPSSIEVPESGTADVSVTFTLRGVVPPQATDQILPMELVAAGDGLVALGAKPFYVVVPGRGLE